MCDFIPLPPCAAENGPAVVILFRKNEIAVADNGLLPRRDALRNGVAFFRMGKLGNMRCCAGTASDEAELPSGFRWQETRSAFLQFPEAERIAAARAKTLLFWQNRRRYCGVCGGELAPEEHECARRCSACGAEFFPVLAPAMIVAVRRDKELLLAHNVRFKPGVYSILAGFVEAGESVEEAIEREVREEVGIGVKNIRYFGSQSWPYPNSLMLGYEAEYADGELAPDGIEIAGAGWFPADRLPQVPAPGSIARELIDKFVRECGN